MCIYIYIRNPRIDQFSDNLEALSVGLLGISGKFCFGESLIKRNGTSCGRMVQADADYHPFLPHCRNPHHNRLFSGGMDMIHLKEKH